MVNVTTMKKVRVLEVLGRARGEASEAPRSPVTPATSGCLGGAGGGAGEAPIPLPHSGISHHRPHTSVSPTLKDK